MCILWSKIVKFSGGVGYLFNGTYDQKYPEGGVVLLPNFEKYPGYFFKQKIGCGCPRQNFKKYRGYFFNEKRLERNSEKILKVFRIPLQVIQQQTCTYLLLLRVTRSFPKVTIVQKPVIQLLYVSSVNIMVDCSLQHVM